MTTLSLSNASPVDLKVDALVVGVSKGNAGLVLTATSEVDRAFKGRLSATLTELGSTGRAGETTKIPTLGAVSAPLVVAVGLGNEGATPADPELLRRAAGSALRALAGVRSVALALPASDAASVGALSEGALLGAYSYLKYRTATAADIRRPAEAVTVLTPAAKDKDVKAAARRAQVVAAAVNFARDLVNAPPSDLPPTALAQAARDSAKGRKVEVTVLEEPALREGGYGGILGVGQGSANPPCLVRLTYRPARATRHLALVGKGITFDSGGLSLKPTASMEWMKSDMSGAAAVIAAVCAIADLELPVRVTGWAPTAENMPSGSAQRPSDVLTMYGGKTVEVLNTDAEGRLVLADALVAAAEDDPDLIVDAATLTGAQMVALGARTSAIMSNDDALRAALHEVATEAGEQMWPMPLPEELRKSMDSAVADIANMGDRYGGMLVAGLFLKDFVRDGLRWAHLDIAGPAFNAGEPFGYTPKGGTGAAVRTFVKLAEKVAAGGV